MEQKRENHLHVQNKQLKSENTSLKLKVKKLKAEKVILIAEGKKLKKLYRSACSTHVKGVKPLEKNCAIGGLLFEGHKHIFDETTLEKLRRLKNGKRGDSTFILHCMRGIFKSVDDLKSKTACGRMKKGIPPETLKTINDIFLERLSQENISDEDFHQRYVRLNALVNSAINNMQRATSHSSKENTISFNVTTCPSPTVPKSNILTEWNIHEVIMD